MPNSKVNMIGHLSLKPVSTGVGLGKLTLTKEALSQKNIPVTTSEPVVFGNPSSVGSTLLGDDISIDGSQQNSKQTNPRDSSQKVALSELILSPISPIFAKWLGKFAIMACISLMATLVLLSSWNVVHTYFLNSESYWLVDYISLESIGLFMAFVVFFHTLFGRSSK